MTKTYHVITGYNQHLNNMSEAGLISLFEKGAFNENTLISEDGNLWFRFGEVLFYGDKPLIKPLTEQEKRIARENETAKKIGYSFLTVLLSVIGFILYFLNNT